MRLVIYHAGCLDGVGAAACAYLIFGDNAEYLPINYGGITYDNDNMTLSYSASQERHSWSRNLTKDSEVFVLDMSFPVEVTDAIIASGVSLVWLDHHKTAIDAWVGGSTMLSGAENTSDVSVHNSRVILDLNRSGAQIAWDYFHGTPRPKIIDYVGDRDLWKFELENTKAVCEGLYHLRPWDVRAWVHLLSQSFDDSHLNETGLILMREANNRVKACVANAVKVKVFDVVGLASNSQNDASQLGHKLSIASGTFGLVWHMKTDGKIVCNFRSSGFDVGSLAKRLGGGGHNSAAGCVVDLKTIGSWIV